MKSLFKVLLFSMLTLFFMSCGHYRDGSSVYSEGGWIIPLILFIAGAIFLWVGKKAASSGSKINPIYGGGEGGNVPFWQTGWPVLMVGFWLGFIIYIIVQNAEK